MPPFCEQTDLLISGSEGYNTFRIPALVATRDDSVLAFFEGRKESSGDAGDIDMMVRRSTDGGISWSASQVVWDDGPNTCGNPCPVVDRETGTIFLLMTHNLGSDKEPQIIDLTSQESRTVWIARSDDDGRTWSTPENVTATTKEPNWTWYATGPGAGIQLSSGRLLVPCDHIESLTNHYYSHVIYSDDHGRTWQLGGSTPTHQVNECEAVELDDGTILLNMRNYDRTQRSRAVAYSKDGGVVWSEVKHDATLIEPICQASIRRYPMEGNHILFSNPADREERTNMTVRYSGDGCQTWSHARSLHTGPSAYSCLAILPGGMVGCLYERGETRPNERLTFARFNLDWIKETDAQDH